MMNAVTRHSTVLHLPPQLTPFWRPVTMFLSRAGTKVSRHTSDRNKKELQKSWIPERVLTRARKTVSIGHLIGQTAPNWIAINAGVFDERICQTRSSKTLGFMNIWFLAKSTNSAPFRAIGRKINRTWVRFWPKMLRFPAGNAAGVTGKSKT